MLYAVVDTQTKSIVQYSELNDDDALAYGYANPRYKLIAADVVKAPDTVHYDEVSEQVLERPGKPHDYVTWDDVGKSWVDNLPLAKKLLNQKVVDRYKQICDGVDPETGNKIYVDCVIGGTTYRMNAGKEAATNMDAGVRIFERSGAANMPVVRDFNNTNHANIPMSEAIEISIQQGADALSYWQQKRVMVDDIENAETVSALLALDLSFEVNV